MQLSRLTLRSKKPELVEQELWGVLLAYNLVRYQMIKMAEHLKEIKQTMQLSRLTLRSKKPELVEQELWGVLLAYNLVRYQMIKMAEHLKGLSDD